MLENDLIDFYEKNTDNVLNFNSVYAAEALKKSGDDTKGVLLPLFSVRQKMDVCITLNIDGTLHKVTIAETSFNNSKKQKTVIMPGTEDSASRSNGQVALPLFDKMPYICNDSTMPGYDANKYNVYITALAKFADYADEHNYPYIRTIYNYIVGSTIYNDIPAKMHKMDNGNVVSFVYFNVFEDCMTHELYNDKQLYTLWEDYYYNVLCADKPIIVDAYTNTQQHRVYNFSKKLLYSSVSSKLFSANNKHQYVGYRFPSNDKYKDSLMPIGAISEQQIAQALRFIGNVQSFSFGNKIGKSDSFNDRIQTMVWGINNSDAIINNDIMSLFAGTAKGQEIDACIEDYDKFSKMVRGYNSKGKYSANAHILAMANTTDGRLAVDYYDYCSDSTLIKNLYTWQAEGKVPISHKRADNTYITYHASPCILDLAKSCYPKTDEAIRIANQLMHNMLSYKRISRSIVSRSMAETSKMQSGFGYDRKKIKSASNWSEWVRDSLYRTCALILHYYNYNKNEGEYVTMSLKTENVSADYAIGRIVSLANDAETAYHKVRDEKNFTTKAVSLATKIQRNPLAGITTLMGQLSKYEKIVAHWNKTHTKQYCYFGISWNEIKNLLADYGDSITNHAVGLDYFIGLTTQEQAIQKRIEDYTARKAEKDNAEKNTEEV